MYILCISKVGQFVRFFKSNVRRSKRSTFQTRWKCLNRLLRIPSTPYHTGNRNNALSIIIVVYKVSYCRSEDINSKTRCENRRNRRRRKSRVPRTSLTFRPIDRTKMCAFSLWLDHAVVSFCHVRDKIGEQHGVFRCSRDLRQRRCTLFRSRLFFRAFPRLVHAVTKNDNDDVRLRRAHRKSDRRPLVRTTTNFTRFVAAADANVVPARVVFSKRRVRSKNTDLSAKKQETTNKRVDVLPSKPENDLRNPRIEYHARRSSEFLVIEKQKQKKQNKIHVYLTGQYRFMDLLMITTDKRRKRTCNTNQIFVTNQQNNMCNNDC